MGAQVALEIAQRLRRNGEQVNLLIAIDSYNFNGAMVNPTLKERVRYEGQKIKFHFSNLMHLGLKGQISYLTDKLKIAFEREMRRLSAKLNKLIGLNESGPGEEFIE